MGISHSGVEHGCNWYFGHFPLSRGTLVTVIRACIQFRWVTTVYSYAMGVCHCQEACWSLSFGHIYSFVLVTAVYSCFMGVFHCQEACWVTVILGIFNIALILYTVAFDFVYNYRG